MSELPIRACIDAYVAAWNERDAAKRRALIEQACSPELRFVTPGQRIIGYDAFDALIAEFQRRRPGDRAVLAGAVDVQGQLFRYAGRVETTTAPTPPDAFDAGECDDDGRIRLILTFTA